MAEQDLARNLAALPVEHLLEKIAGDRPLLPAGGSAAALAGATAAALGGFVSRIARRHAKTDADGRTLDSITEEFDRHRLRFADLITEDARAYAEAGTMLREKTADADTARRKMTGPPEAMAEGGVALLELYARLLPYIHKPTTADAAVGIELAKSCTDSAVTILRASEPSRDVSPHARIENLVRHRDRCCGRLRHIMKNF